MLLNVPCAGLPQTGVFAVFAVPDVQVRLAGGTVVPSLQVTVGGVTGEPAVPVPGTSPQVSAGAAIVKEGVHVVDSGAGVEPHTNPDTFTVLVPVVPVILYVREPVVDCHAVMLDGVAVPEKANSALALPLR